MADYSKWEKLTDEDEDDLDAAAKTRAEYQEACREEQEAVEQWLRRNMSQLQRSEAEQKGKDPLAPPELIRNSQQPFRKASREDLRALSMLMVLSHFEENETNLTRHPQLLDLVRHNRWMEEDPGAVELLCRIHNLHMKAAEDKGRAPVAPKQEQLEMRYRHMCLSAINTLAAPKKANCAGGLLEIVNTICTPKTPEAQQMRLKWQKKEFGKDALFDSLFPDLKQFRDEYDKNDSWWDVYLMAAFMVLLIIGLGCLFYFGMSAKPEKLSTTTTTTLSTLASPNAEL